MPWYRSTRSAGPVRSWPEARDGCPAAGRIPGGFATGIHRARVAAHSTTKVTRMFTRHSITLPSRSVTTLVSLIQAPWMFLTLSAVFFSPDLTASSTLVLDDELISMTLATAMVASPSEHRDGIVTVATDCTCGC